MTAPTLLGYLARFGSFSAQSEVLCTQGLTYLLQEYEDARSALAAEVAARTGIVNVEPRPWHAEVVRADQGRSVCAPAWRPPMISGARRRDAV